MTDIVKFEDPEVKPNIIKVMGVGGGGSNAVTHMFTAGITGVDFILCNTDDQALQQPRLCSGSHLPIGDSTTGNHYAPNSGIFGLEVSNSLMNCLSSSKLPKLKWPSPPKGGKSTAGSGCHRSRLKLIPVLTHPHQAPPLENVSPDGKWTQRTPTI